MAGPVRTRVLYRVRIGSEQVAIYLGNREVELLDMLIEGYTNDDMSKRLHMAHRTVKAHFNRLFLKFRIHHFDGIKRVKLAVQWYRKRRCPMELVVNRNRPTKHSTTGQLSLNDELLYTTLEPPPVPDLSLSGNGYRSIPAGTYQLTIRWSPKFSKAVPHVENVPGRTFIELHIGNFPSDTDGCTLIGTILPGPVQPDYIAQSSLAWADMMTRMYAESTLTNPEAPVQEQVWNIGTITYNDAQIAA